MTSFAPPTLQAGCATRVMIHLSGAAALALTALGAQAQSVAWTPSSPVAAVQVPTAPPTAAVESAEPREPAEEEWKPALKVGDATRGLLALQSSGAAASPVARPIPGDVAGRSYQRYIKSFDYAIPERFGAAVKSSGLNSGSQ
ncbi:DUF3613 domain-containing protein [Variovorax ginsengisoli]|uniref:DUF3613 domain-containing protein n=1 Tax=Variovorax ginsengisoli TaxID=363844 RepID=A0ABT9SH38_9BURK|nr:DUF3613 domain-containing protein [Variovorax ginsengisoli]MDP9902707.1 hypothetical protein [Variovorax ginsengisoli]